MTRLCVLFLLVALQFLTSRAQPVQFSLVNTTIATPTVLQREGSIYGNAGGPLLYIAGGVNFIPVSNAPLLYQTFNGTFTANLTQAQLTYFNSSNPSAPLPQLYPFVNTSNATFSAFSDVWAFNLTSLTYTNFSVQLALPSYFGTGGWSFALGAIVLYSGRTNNQFSQTQNTYASNVQLVTFPNASASYNGSTSSSSGIPVVSVLTLTPPRTPRQFASSLTFNGTMYVLQGVTGPTGNTPITTDPFFLINLTSGSTMLLSSASNFPSQNIINPVIFTSSSLSTLFVYSGLQADFGTFASPSTIFVYAIASNTWLTPVTYVASAAPPPLVFGAWAETPTFQYLLITGGSLGTSSSSPSSTSLYNTNTSSSISLINSSPLTSTTATANTTALITVTPVLTLSPRERGSAGFTWSTTPSSSSSNPSYLETIFLSGGAIYRDSLQLLQGSGVSGSLLGINTSSSVMVPVPLPAYVNFTTVFSISWTNPSNVSSSSSSSVPYYNNSSSSSASLYNFSSSSSSSYSTGGYNQASSSSSLTVLPYVPSGPSGASSSGFVIALAVIIGLAFGGVLLFLAYKRFYRGKVIVSGTEMTSSASTSPRISRGGSFVGVVGNKGYVKTGPVASSSARSSGPVQPSRATVEDDGEDQILDDDDELDDDDSDDDEEMGGYSGRR